MVVVWRWWSIAAAGGRGCTRRGAAAGNRRAAAHTGRVGRARLERARGAGRAAWRRDCRARAWAARTSRRAPLEHRRVAAYLVVARGRAAKARARGRQRVSAAADAAEGPSLKPQWARWRPRRDAAEERVRGGERRATPPA